MSSNVILFGWSRSVPGRERASGEHFDEFVGYLGGLQKKGAIQSYDIVFLDPHGGDLNGFFLLKGEAPKLDALVASKEWTAHITRALLHLQGPGVVRGVTGEQVTERMALWKSSIPS